MRAILITLFCSFILGCSSESTDDNSLVRYKLELNRDANLDMSSEYIIVIGDIQEYTNGAGYDFYYKSTMNWIYSQYNWGVNIKCILQVGDLTYNNAQWQYEIFNKYTLPIADYIPYIACIGNHDYTWNAMSQIESRENTQFSNYTSFKSTQSMIVSRFENNKMENVVIKNEIGGHSCYILVLEFGPRDEVLEWAFDFVQKHQDYKFILMTHEYLSRNGERIMKGSYAELQLKNTSWNSPEQIWQKLVKRNDNIVCVLCGHNGFFTHLASKNQNGRLVSQILFNLQYLENGGNGLVQLWELPQGCDSLCIRVYNTISHEWQNDAGELKIRFNY